MGTLLEGHRILFIFKKIFEIYFEGGELQRENLQQTLH